MARQEDPTQCTLPHGLLYCTVRVCPARTPTHTHRGVTFAVFNMVLLGGSDDESTTYLRGTDLLPVLESAVEHMLEECQKPENHKMKPENLMSMLATWLKEHNPKRDPEMAAKVAEMHDALAAEAAAAAVMMENATKVQASVRGRQARLKAKGIAADAEEAKALEAEAKAAAEAMEAATRVQASVRGRQTRAKLTSKEIAEGVKPDLQPEPTEEEVVAADEAAAAATRVQASIRGRQARAKALAEGAPATEADPDASAEVSAEELEAEARAADEAAEAAIRVQASIRGRQSRAKMKKAE